MCAHYKHGVCCTFTLLAHPFFCRCKWDLEPGLYRTFMSGGNPGGMSDNKWYPQGSEPPLSALPRPSLVGLTRALPMIGEEIAASHSLQAELNGAPIQTQMLSRGNEFEFWRQGMPLVFIGMHNVKDTANTDQLMNKMAQGPSDLYYDLLHVMARSPPHGRCLWHGATLLTPFSRVQATKPT